MSVVPPPPPALSGAGPSSHFSRANAANRSKAFDVVAAYKRALADHVVPHPIAAILALVELMETSTATTSFGLAEELKNGRETLMNTQTSLGVRAGCQLWERFFSLSGGGDMDFPTYKRTLISQGRSFCTGTAPQCREKIAALATDFLSDDVTILTHSYSRTVIQTILRAHAQNKRIQVYVTEARPGCLGMKTYQILTAKGVPCTIVLDSAVGYVMERVDLVLVGSEVVVESGALVSSVGTYQVALVAKAMQKPFYALAESYKFLRHYPLSQTDLPMPRHTDSTMPEKPLTFPSHSKPQSASDSKMDSRGRPELGEDMERRNPTVDVTAPDLIDFIITDLGAPLSPTSVSQYLVAQFSS